MSNVLKILVHRYRDSVFLSITDLVIMSPVLSLRDTANKFFFSGVSPPVLALFDSLSQRPSYLRDARRIY